VLFIKLYSNRRLSVETLEKEERGKVASAIFSLRRMIRKSSLVRKAAVVRQ